MYKSKCLIMLLASILSVSSILIAGLVTAQSNQSAPEFTLRYIDKSYDTAPKTTSTIDPYTGNVTTSTISGYHISYKTIEVTIANNIGASYYALRYKGHYSETWTYFPYNAADDHNIYDGFFPPQFQASNSSTTVGYLSLDSLPQPIPEGAPIDVQVQVMYGNFDVTPYSHAQYVGGPTYDAAFKGTTGEWSNTQTITLPTNEVSVSPTPTVPEFTAIAILPLLIAGLLSVAIIRKKQANSKTAIR